LNLQGEQRHQARTSHNWPGYGGRAPLTIHANKFVVHFKTNGSLNDWGFKMQVSARFV